MRLPLRRKQRTLPTQLTDYPSGTFLRVFSATKDVEYYYVSNGKKYRLPSKRVFDSWSPTLVVDTTDTAVEHLPTGVLGFRPGTLIYCIKGGTIYLVSDNKRCPITSPDVLDRLGAGKSDILVVSDTEINLHDEGEPLS